MEIRRISAEETIDVRHRTLRVGRPRATAYLDEDNEPGAFHLGAFVDGVHAGTASFFHHPNREVLAELPGIEPTELYRLRQMGTLPEFRGLGVGRALLDAAYPLLRELGGTVLWCDARLAAVDFYRANGLATLGPEYDVPLVGPHYLMWKRI